MNEHSQFEEDLNLYALGALDPDEKQAFEEHLKVCPDCAQKLEEANGCLALIGLAEPLVAPPAGAKERLMARIKPRPQSQPAPTAHTSRRWMALVFAPVVILLLVIVALLVQRNRSLDQRLSDLKAEAARQEQEVERARNVLQVLTAPGTLQVTLTAANAHPLPQGKTFYNPQKGLLFYASNLPPSPSGRTYQLWLVPQKGQPISAGVFNPDSRGNAEIILPGSVKGVKAAAFAVTIEPAGGVPQPTGPKVLIGAAS